MSGSFTRPSRKAINMIDADAIIIHLNFLQEVVQPEGDRRAKGCLSAIKALASKFPLMAKETGAGISRETAQKLKASGARAIDVGGLGGTSFSAVEHYRARKEAASLKERLGATFWNWGIPTITSSSAVDQLESLLKPYRDRSNAHIQAIWEEFAAEHPVGAFPSSRTMRDNSRLFTAGKRYRYALALAGYQLLTGEPPSRGLERAATWLEWYHLYKLFLDAIMDEDVRRRTLASAWATDAKLFRGPGADRPAMVFRTQRHRYAVSHAILDALRIRSLAERAIEGATDLHPSIRLELR